MLQVSNPEYLCVQVNTMLYCISVMLKCLYMVYIDITRLSKKFHSRRKVHILNYLGSYATLVHDELPRPKRMVGTYLTVEKRTKRMPDATVETTFYAHPMPPKGSIGEMHILKLRLQKCWTST